MVIKTSSAIIRVPAPRLSKIEIDTDKDWLGFRIKNLGEPEEPSDAVTKNYTDISVTGLGINYYLLDDADSDVPSYKAMQLTPPNLSEAYVETSQNSAGDYYIAGWIAPVDGIPRLKLGVYTMHLQAERVSGNIPVRLFFEIYERKSDGTEILIAQSSVSDRIDSRRDIVISLILSSDYELAEGSRIVFKLYARYESNGSSTTVRVYYQGAVKSRVALPTIKEILDTQYAPLDHTHTRDEITDLWNSPFWDNIPDKPFDTLGSEFQVVNGELQIASIDFSKVLNRKLSLMTIDTDLVLPAGYKFVVSDSTGNKIYSSVGGYTTLFILQVGDSKGVWIRLENIDRIWIIGQDLNEAFSIRDSVDGFNYIERFSIDPASGVATLYVDLSPDDDNSRDLGSASLRWANAYIVNLYTGDVILDNKWRITEYDEAGKLLDGIRILNNRGEEVFRVTNDGLYYKGVKIA